MAFFNRFCCRFNLVPTQNPNFILGSRGLVNCTYQTTIWSEKYITTLILLISVTFEAIWGGGADLTFYPVLFQYSNIPISGAGADGAAGAVFRDTPFSSRRVKERSNFHT